MESLKSQLEEVKNENSGLINEMEYWKQLYSGTTPDLQRALSETENLTEQLLEARSENTYLRQENYKIAEELQMLKEDRSVQENQTEATKMYASLLESMLDSTQDFSDPMYSTSEKDAARIQELTTSNSRLQQENKDLKDMMEEFKNQWTKDSKHFHEKIRVVKEKGSHLQLEVLRLQQLHAQDQGSLGEVLTLKQAEVEAHKKTKEANTQLKSSLEKFQKDNEELCERQAELESLIQMKCDEIGENLEKINVIKMNTAQRIEDLEADWKFKEGAYKAEILIGKGELENLKATHESEKEELDTYVQTFFNEMESKNTILERQLQLLKTENSNIYDQYCKYEVKAKDLEKALNEARASADRAKRASKIFQEEVHEANRYRDAAHRDMTRLEEKMSALTRDYQLEKEKMEEKHADQMIQLRQKYSTHIEEVKHNNMLAINQEMIKSQMALEAEKKKCAAECTALKKDLEAANNKFEIFKTATNTIKFADRAKLAKLTMKVELLEEEAQSEAVAFEETIQAMKAAHQRAIANLGVEELDDEPRYSHNKEVSEPAEWELVDEDEDEE